jgi:hypothetical protein
VRAKGEGFDVKAESFRWSRGRGRVKGDWGVGRALGCEENHGQSKEVSARRVGTAAEVALLVR